jgi:hypothetical protein
LEACTLLVRTETKDINVIEKYIDIFDPEVTKAEIQRIMNELESIKNGQGFYEVKLKMLNELNLLKGGTFWQKN